MKLQGSVSDAIGIAFPVNSFDYLWFYLALLKQIFVVATLWLTYEVEVKSRFFAYSFQKLVLADIQVIQYLHSLFFMQTN